MDTILTTTMSLYGIPIGVMQAYWMRMARRMPTVMYMPLGGPAGYMIGLLLANFALRGKPEHLPYVASTISTCVASWVITHIIINRRDGKGIE